MSTSSREEHSPCTISSRTTELVMRARAGFSSSPVIPSPTPSGAYPTHAWEQRPAESLLLLVKQCVCQNTLH